ncbi:MAG TPA: hypothetical protein VFL13_07950 [Candidatus Baltobacteraceae bacterium]|nr:hypothetical protein [Candidatus Baltobacteraceae bacterium]
MRRAPDKPDFALYLKAFAVYGRNLGVLVPLFVGMLVVVAFDLIGNWLWSPVGGAGAPLTGLIGNLVLGFAFGVALIFADDGWRHGRANLRTAWDSGRRNAGNILLAVLGFGFILYVAGAVGAILPIPYLSLLLQLLALWAFIYAVPAAAIGGIPGGAAFSVSLQTAKANPLATIVLLIVCAIVYVGITVYAMNAIAFSLPYYALEATKFLLTSLALGYIATVMAKQYTDLRFRPYW